MMSTSTVVAWLVSLMALWSPPSYVARGVWPELRHETEAQTLARYAELAESAYAVAQRETPLLAETDGPDRGDDRARQRTALILLSLAFYESRFHNRVTTMRGTDRKRSDGGRAWCAVQILLDRRGVGNRGKGGHLARLIPDGWTGPDLEADPVKCLTVGYRFAADSIRVTGDLGGYTGEGRGGVKARNRLRRAIAVVLPEPEHVEPTEPGFGAVAIGPDDPPPF